MQAEALDRAGPRTSWRSRLSGGRLRTRRCAVRAPTSTDSLFLLLLAAILHHPRQHFREHELAIVAHAFEFLADAGFGAPAVAQLAEARQAQRLDHQPRAGLAEPARLDRGEA